MGSESDSEQLWLRPDVMEWYIEDLGEVRC